ncbi:hypothetical protein Rhe02_81340 [Rhizocola hellebori]|uniref:Protein-L-isoaspartate O-methyltransferase n=1 Tax=Rhizocola hellebori TaxID=1392758 RepID=A0A8J3QHD9_9ACTN|nr:methyltransferase, FxLD system [Rhizocola hellebori]GIH10067.1 hypothetical protein Rhe02_81340 [Rhizocola hellebori]
MNVSTEGNQGIRDAMVDQIMADHEARGLRLPRQVEAALRTVPRELFALPGTALIDVYHHDKPLITKRRGDETISSVSAAWLQAAMLGQAYNALGSLDGKHVLEIGSGGYNAALLSELTGPQGSVTTVDIDSDVAGRAQECLAEAGYPDVTVVCADASEPIDPPRFYDLIIVTAGAWDIPAAWTSQLAETGVLVVPMRTFGLTRSWALARNGDRLTSRSQLMCGFVAMQGSSAYELRYADIAPGVHLRLDEGEHADPQAIGTLLELPQELAWAGVSLAPRTVLADLDLWLATRVASEGGQFLVLTAQEEAIESGVVSPSWRFGTPATFAAGTFGYRSDVRWTGDRFDLGARAHGPEAATTAQQLIEHMRAWVEAGTPSPTLHAAPAKTPDGDLPAGTVLDKRHRRLVLTFTPA